MSLKNVNWRFRLNTSLLEMELTIQNWNWNKWFYLYFCVSKFRILKIFELFSNSPDFVNWEKIEWKSELWESQDSQIVRKSQKISENLRKSQKISENLNNLKRKSSKNDQKIWKSEWNLSNLLNVLRFSRRQQSFGDHSKMFSSLANWFGWFEISTKSLGNSQNFRKSTTKNRVFVNSHKFSQFSQFSQVSKMFSERFWHALRTLRIDFKSIQIIRNLI